VFNKLTYLLTYLLTCFVRRMFNVRTDPILPPIEVNCGSSSYDRTVVSDAASAAAGTAGLILRPPALVCLLAPLQKRPWTRCLPTLLVRESDLMSPS